MVISTTLPSVGRSVHASQPAIFVAPNFVSAAASHGSSTVALPCTTAAVHSPIAPASFPTALATPFSHFVTGPLGASAGMLPESSPPKGVPVDEQYTMALCSSTMPSTAAARAATSRHTGHPDGGFA